MTMDEPGLNPHIELAHLLLLFARDRMKEGRLDKALKFVNDAIEELEEFLREEAKEIANGWSK